MPLVTDQKGIFTFRHDTHQYFVDGIEIPGVSDILEEGGLKHGWQGFSQAQERGIKVHQACELLDLDDLDWASLGEWPLEWRNLVKSWERFKADTGFVPELIEYQGYHPQFRFAGTLDRRGRFPGEAVSTILDLKTGAKEDWHRFQTEGYKVLGGPAWANDKRAAVYLQTDGSCAKLEWFTNPEDLKLFLSALTITHYKRSRR